MVFKENKELEKGLRSDWEAWNSKCHVEDQMSFMDYVFGVKYYKDHVVKVDVSGSALMGYEGKILFKKR
jgi:hypothetical protein